MSSEAVSNDVRRKALPDSGLLTVNGQLFPERLTGHGRPARRHEEEFIAPVAKQLRPPAGQILRYCVQRRFADRHHSLFISLPCYPDDSEIERQAGKFD